MFSWNGAEIAYRARKAAEWTKVSVVVVGTGGLDRFTIRESTAAAASNSLGPVIDMVELKAINTRQRFFRANQAASWKILESLR